MSRVLRVLAAVSLHTADRVRRILQGHELRQVETLSAAESTLDADGIDLIFVGAQFDESRMFDLLDYLRLHAEHRKIPVVAALVSKSALAAESVSGLGHAVKLAGATVFLNFNDFPDDEVGNRRLRVIIEALVAPPEMLPKILFP